MYFESRFMSRKSLVDRSAASAGSAISLLVLAAEGSSAARPFGPALSPARYRPTTYSYSYSYSFSYSFSHGGGGWCGESCPAEVLAAYEADDFGTFCHLDLSCFEECPMSGTNDLYYAALCTCDWGTVQGGFVNFLLGNPDGPYCCSSQACDDAILAYEVNINPYYEDNLAPFMADVCADPTKSETCVDTGAFYTCGTSCPSDVQNAFEAGDGAAFCALDYSCLADCGDDMVNYYDAYCGCGEQSNYGGDFVPYQPWDYGDFYSTAPGSLYCCGAPACKAAITNLYTPAWSSKLPTMCDAVTCAPTAVPTPSPTVSLKPTPAPSFTPTSAPTLAPTTGDMATVALSLSMEKNAAPTPTDETELKATIVSELGVAPSTVKDFAVSSSITGRRRRRLLATYTWVTTFEVAQPLSESGAASPTAFAASVTTTLTAPSFATAVAASVGATVDTTSIVAVVMTRHPSPVPTPQPQTPTVMPIVGGNNNKNNKNNGNDNDDTATAGVVIGAVVLVLVVVGGVAVAMRARGPKSRQVSKGVQLGELAYENPMKAQTSVSEMELQGRASSSGGIGVY